MRHIQLRFPFLLGIAATLLSNLQGNEQLLELKQKTDRWIELRTRLTEERTAWRSERDILKTSIETLEANTSSVDESLSFYKNANRDLESKVELAKQKEASSQAINEQIALQIERYEQRIRIIHTRLPQPLKDQLSPLFGKIPSDPSQTATPLANRLQNVVAIMTMIDEFNQSLFLSRSIRAFEDDQNIEVRALYWGLSYGLATSANGDKAWLLLPSANEWQWIDYSQDAAAIRELFRVYDKKTDPKIVTIPFQTDR